MLKNKILVLLLTPLIFFLSCKKMIENKQKDVFVAVMVAGEWHVEKYIEAETPITEQFNGYRFQFNEDGSVMGSLNGAAAKGTWEGDIQNRSISSNFPDADNPVKKLNGDWKITDSGLNFVHAEMETAAGKMLLHLEKLP